jgi:hypothetical protein
VTYRSKEDLPYEFEMAGTMGKVAAELAVILGPRKYWLPYQVGGDDWEVISSHYNVVVIRLKDPTVATWIGLKL